MTRTIAAQSGRGAGSAIAAQDLCKCGIFADHFGRTRRDDPGKTLDWANGAAEKGRHGDDRDFL
jgi:hypothetical protein